MRSVFDGRAVERMSWSVGTSKLMLAVALVAVIPVLAACGGGSHAQAPGVSRTSTHSAASTTASSDVPSPPVVHTPGKLGPTWTAVATVSGEAAAWAAQRGGVTLVRFDQRLVHLALHAGSEEPEGGGWPYGSDIGARESDHVVAGFNGGFKLSYGSVGFMARGRVAVALTPGLASIVTYRDGSTQIGAWQQGVPAPGRGGVASVLQNLHLLVDHGEPAPTVRGCAIECWGATLGGGIGVARSALGITGGGELVWAAGERLSPAEIADALIGAGVQRAVELDINPEWVAGYLYVHRSSRLRPAPLVPEQPGIPGELLTPNSRDFFTVLAN